MDVCSDERLVAMLELVKLPLNIRTLDYKTSTIDFSYPVVYGMQNKTAEYNINYNIYHTMLGLIGELQRPDLKTYISGSYEIKTNLQNVFSLILIGLGDFGGAHPMTYVRALNMDVLTGKNYQLSELFKPNSNYLKRLSDIIAEQIKERDIPLFEEFKGIRPNQDYYIADVNLIIFFQLYEITSYAQGFPYFSIPIYEIQDIVDEKGLLNNIAGII